MHKAQGIEIKAKTERKRTKEEIMGDFQKLKVWHKAKDLAVFLYNKRFLPYACALCLTPSATYAMVNHQLVWNEEFLNRAS